MEKRIRVVIYIRVSTREQSEEGYSIGEQQDRLLKYCEAMGWEVVKIYIDPGYTGSNIDRPGLQSMIHDIEEGGIDKVVVYKLDRLSRSQFDTLYLINKVFLANNCDFTSSTESFDTSTPFGRAMLGILAVFAELEREKIRERMLDGKLGKAKEGYWQPAGHIPIGYDYIPGSGLKINKYEAMQVEEIFDLFLKGERIRGIERIMREKGFSHKHGKWLDRSVRNVLQNVIYTGKNKFKGNIYQGTHDAIISQEDFDKVQEIYKNRYLDNKRSSSYKVNSYLGGLLHCAHCGGRLQKHSAGRIRKDGTRVRYYGCGSRIKRNKDAVKDPNCKNKIWRLDVLDQLIFDEIKKLKLDPMYFKTLKQEAETDSSEAKIEVLESRLGELDDELDRLVGLYQKGRMRESVLDKAVDKVEAERSAIKEEITNIRENGADSPPLSPEEAEKIVEDFVDIVESGDYKAIRSRIEALIDRIEIDNENIKIFWNFL